MNMRDAIAKKAFGQPFVEANTCPYGVSSVEDR